MFGAWWCRDHPKHADVDVGPWNGTPFAKPVTNSAWGQAEENGVECDVCEM